ncbi:MAG: hypothetical protein U1F43_03500 [Myxococcota bacterium]
MRRLASLSCVIVALTTLGSAAAAAEPRQQFIDMGLTNIVGDIKAPGASYFHGRDPAIFERMLKLRKDMLPGIKKALRDPAFK